MFTEEGRYNYAQRINRRNCTHTLTKVKNLNYTAKIFFLINTPPQYRSLIYNEKLSEY